MRRAALAGAVLAAGLATVPAQAARPQVRVKLPAALTSGAPAQVTGRVTGRPQRGREAVLQQAVGGRPTTLAKARVARSGRFTLRFTVPALAGAARRELRAATGSLTLQVAVTRGGRTLARSGARAVKTALPPTPSLPPTPALPPTPSLTPPAEPPAPTPSLSTRAYAIRYEGHASYSFHRKNTAHTGGTTSSLVYDHNTDLGWTTDFADLVIGPGAQDGRKAPISQALTGDGTSKRTGKTGNDPPEVDSCGGSSAEDLWTSAPDQWPPPFASASPTPDGAGVTLRVEATGHMDYASTVCDVSREKLVFINTDEDVTTHDELTADDVLDQARFVSYADLAALKPGSSKVLTVGEPPGRGDVDCRDPSVELVECNSDLVYDGKVTITARP